MDYLNDKQIELLHKVVCDLTLQELVKLNPTMDEMRCVEYVRDIHHGHYPRYGNDHQLRTVISLLEKGGFKLDGN